MSMEALVWGQRLLWEQNPLLTLCLGKSGKEYEGKTALGEGGPPALSLSRWLPGVPE